MNAQVVAYRKMTCIALLAVAVTSTSGCCLLLGGGAVGAAGGGYAYYQGRECQTYNSSFEETWSATHNALADLAMPIVQEDAAKGLIESRTGNGKKVRLDVSSQPSKIPADGEVTRVCARVAVFGDQEVSQRVFDQIQIHLASTRSAEATDSSSAIPPETSLPPFQPLQQTIP
jgi:hypothetical protein